MESILTVVPFIGLILSLAIGPIIKPKFWHKHYGKVAFFWAILSIYAMFYNFTTYEIVHKISHTLIAEYLPFIILTAGLYIISHHMSVYFMAPPTPLYNVLFLGISALCSSIIGTSGASMLLIYPFLKLNNERQFKVHQVIFFIFLVSNIGGSLTPIGDPPLFLGFLNGVTFSWTFFHMLYPFIISIIFLLIVFYFMDSYFYKKEVISNFSKSKISFHINHKLHFAFLIGVVCLVLISGLWKPQISFTLLDQKIELQNIVRDLGIISLTLLSILMRDTKREVDFEPLYEVAKVFLCIFICLTPVIKLLYDYAPQLKEVMTPTKYFYITGVLSSFLDNAPTYLMFFHMAGGNAPILMTEGIKILLAISMGAVFMGANTYIGNAPNFMVRSICERKGIKMPSFFGYMKWSISILGPLYIILSLLLF